MTHAIQPARGVVAVLTWARLVTWLAAASIALGLLLWLAASFAGLHWTPPRVLQGLVWPGLPVLSLLSTILQMVVQFQRWRSQNLSLVERIGWLAFAGLLLVVVVAAYVQAPEWAMNGAVGAAFAIALPLVVFALRRKWLKA